MHPSHLGNWLSRFQQRHQLPPLKPPRLPPHHDQPPAVPRRGQREHQPPVRAFQRGHHHQRLRPRDGGGRGAPQPPHGRRSSWRPGAAAPPRKSRAVEQKLNAEEKPRPKRAAVFSHFPGIFSAPPPARKWQFIDNFHSRGFAPRENLKFKRVEIMNKSKFLKKSLAMLLALMLVLAMIPLSASAAPSKGLQSVFSRRYSH